MRQPEFDPSVTPLVVKSIEALQAGNPVAGRALARRGLSMSPALPLLWRCVGTAAFQLEPVAVRLAAMRRATWCGPNDADAWNDRAVAEAGAATGGERRALMRAAALVPGNAGSWRNLALSAEQDRDLAHADELSRRSTALSPLDSEMWLTQGRIALAARRTRDAMRAFRRATCLEPAQEGNLVGLGLATKDADGWPAAAIHFGRAIGCNHLSPPAWGYFGAAKLIAGEADRAVVALRRAQVLQPGSSQALSALGNLHVDRAAFDSARRYLLRATAVDADTAEPRINLGLIDLLHGRYDEGWRGFRQRWCAQSHGGFAWRPGVARWGGETAPEATLLIRAEPEQALGDTIQFARFVPLAVRQVGRVILECDVRLHDLLRSLDPAPMLIGIGTATPEPDFEAGLMDLPDLFVRVESDIPSAAYLRPSDGAVDAWKRRLAHLPRPLIGFCWRGNPKFRLDHLRSPGLDVLEAIRRAGNGHLVSLVKTPAMGEMPAEGIHDPMSEVEDLAATAALIASLDLVISSDTVIAHLAGAIGKPAWIMLHEPPDWRWLVNRSDSPWYEGAELFRQPRPGDWRAVASAVSERLMMRQRQTNEFKTR